MALLRQCLRELREQRHEWDIPDEDWPETKRQSEEALTQLRASRPPRSTLLTLQELLDHVRPVEGFPTLHRRIVSQ